jgi:predicted metal-dependent enzyme (double-stranded beta helix superfamily)
MFRTERFVQDCLDASREGEAHLNVRPILERALADPAAILAGLGEPRSGLLAPLYRSDSLTILNVVWKPGAVIRPHNHQTWAVIGVYAGREDNIFWRRVGAGPRGIEAAGARSLLAGDIAPLGKDIIHSVVNPLGRLTGAIHIYGGDFFRIERSEWDDETLSEQPYDQEKTRALFAD